jgi:hypothetical protein
MECIESMGFSPKILNFFFCSNQVFLPIKIIERKKSKNKIRLSRAVAAVAEICAPSTA